MPSNEAAVLKSIVEYLQWQNWPVFRQFTGSVQSASTGAWIRGQEQGTADIICGYRDEYHKTWLIGFIEVKDKSNLSMAQVSFLRRMAKLGCPWLVARSVEDVTRWKTDVTFHGNESDTMEVLDENKKFTPKIMPKTKRLSMSTLNEFNDWSE